MHWNILGGVQVRLCPAEVVPAWWNPPLRPTPPRLTSLCSLSAPTLADAGPMGVWRGCGALSPELLLMFALCQRSSFSNARNRVGGKCCHMKLLASSVARAAQRHMPCMGTNEERSKRLYTGGAWCHHVCALQHSAGSVVLEGPGGPCFRPRMMASTTHKLQHTIRQACRRSI